jgi:hypothetical protein
MMVGSPVSYCDDAFAIDIAGSEDEDSRARFREEVVPKAKEIVKSLFEKLDDRTYDSVTFDKVVEDGKYIVRLMRGDRVVKEYGDFITTSDFKSSGLIGALWDGLLESLDLRYVGLNNIIADRKGVNQLFTKMVGCTPKNFTKVFNANMLNHFLDTPLKKSLADKYCCNKWGRYITSLINGMLSRLDVVEVLLGTDYEKLIPYIVLPVLTESSTYTSVYGKNYELTVDNVLDKISDHLDISGIINASDTKNKHIARFLSKFYKKPNKDFTVRGTGTLLTEPVYLFDLPYASFAGRTNIPNNLVLRHAKKYRRLCKISEYSNSGLLGANYARSMVLLNRDPEEYLENTFEDLTKYCNHVTEEAEKEYDKRLDQYRKDLPSLLTMLIEPDLTFISYKRIMNNSGLVTTQRRLARAEKNSLKVRDVIDLKKALVVSEEFYGSFHTLLGLIYHQNYKNLSKIVDVLVSELGDTLDVLPDTMIEALFIQAVCKCEELI